MLILCIIHLRYTIPQLAFSIKKAIIMLNWTGDVKDIHLWNHNYIYPEEYVMCQSSLLSRPSLFAKVFENDFCMGPFFSRKIFEVALICANCPLIYITLLYWYENSILHFLNSPCSFSFLFFLIIKHNMIVLTKIETWKMLLNRQNYVVMMLLLMLIANKMMLTEKQLYRRGNSFHFPFLWLVRLLRSTC